MTSPTPSGPRCPSCGGAVAWTANPARPFCSITCKLVDLGGWLDENYRVPGEPLASDPRPDADVHRSDG
jgi:hypothetical protein